jgi:hypothetical protein
MILDFGFDIDEWAELATEDNLRVRVVGRISLDSDIWYFVAGPGNILTSNSHQNFKRLESDDIPDDWVIEMVEADELEPVLSRNSHLGVV